MARLSCEKAIEMSLEFAIQTSNPRLVGASDSDDESVCEAMQTAFPLMTEYALLVWSGVFIPLNYKHDLSLMFADILGLVERLRESDSGTMEIAWPTNGFRVDWRLSWSNERVTVDADSRSIGVLAGVLRDKPTVNVDLAAFCGEWMQVLSVIHRCLSMSGYGEVQLPELARVRALGSDEARTVLYASGRPAQSSVAPDGSSSVAPPGAPSSAPRVNAGIGPAPESDDGDDKNGQ